MRIAHILDRTDVIGGVQTYLGHLLPALRKRGIDGIVLTGSPGDAVEAETLVVPHVADDGPSLSSAADVALRAALERVRPALVVQHVATSPGVTKTAADVAPVVVHAHDYFMACPGGALYLHKSASFCDEGFGLRCFWRAYTERTTNRRPDRLLRAYNRTRAWDDGWRVARRVVVASEFVADVYAARGIPRDLIRVVGYPVPPAPPAEPAADAPDVLFIGRLADNKGVHVLVDAAAQLPGVSVAIAGDGPARSALETRARDRGVESQIRFLGWIDPERRNALLRGSRLFVLPSLWDEPFGIVGVEALGAGLPVVASDAGGVGAWLDDGVTGTLVPRGDATLLAAAIRVLLSDEERRTRYADAARVAALRHSVDEHLASLLPALGLA